MRVYAVLGNTRYYISVATLCFGLVNPAIVIYLYVKSTPEVFDFSYGSCSLREKIPALAYNCWMMGARTSSMLADALALIMTWNELRQIPSGPTLGLQAGRSITGIIMRDNTVYFGFLFAVNLLGLALGLYTVDGLGTTYVLSDWISTCAMFDVTASSDSSLQVSDRRLTAMIMPRFMLDLREGGAADIYGSNSRTGNDHTIEFANRTQAQNTDGSFPESDGGDIAVVVEEGPPPTA
ncbi:hypothetical protein B0H21DRAFT_710381 [Amylocystis lapponica]|nr:hypothetical protein B0H21DRAFT_710381 [Amylocystis lapponica]